MSYITFTPIDQYAYDGQSGQWLPNAGVTTSYRTENALLIEDILQTTPEGLPLVSILFVNVGGRLESLVVQSALPAISSLKDSILFLYIPGVSTYITPASGGFFISNQDRWLNRDYIISTTPSSLKSQDGQALNQLLYRVGETQRALFVSEATTAQLTGQDVVVEPQPATEFIFTNPLSLCYDITVVNHATGATNTIHTPLVAADYFNSVDRYIVPFGGFMVVFEANDYSRTFIYFIDNDGNLVDQIDGTGPGYDWGEIDYRLVWGADFDATGSVLKIFDGKNVRTHEFPFTAGFNMNPWSEGDSSKNLYVPFLVFDNATLTTHLYLSTPGGGLIDLDYDTWYDNEAWSTIHPTSDKIFRSTEGSNGFNVLEVYSEDGVKINSFNLSDYNVNDDLDRNYYGANGDFVTAFYNDLDNTVPYLFLVYKAATNTFVTFTSETAVNGYSINYIDHELYDRNVSAANVLTLVIGVSSPSAINGMADWSAGSTIHWVPANGTSWQSFENNNGDAFSLSYDAGYFGTYPLFITTQDSIPGLAGENLYAILLGEESHALLSTGIAAADAVNVITSCLHDYTYARIEIAGDPANVTQWIVYSDEVVATASTSTNYDYRQEGGTIVVLDGNDANNNWSWTTAAVNTVGDIIVPTATDSFIIPNNSYGYWNPWGYSTNGKQVLIDKDGLDHVVGFYFLTEDSTAWTYMPNAWDNGTERAWVKGLNNFAFMTHTGDPIDGSYVYMNYDIATGAFISGGTTEISSGGNFGINAIGDRQSARVELGPAGYEHNCFTAAGIVKVTTDSGYDIAYNDAVWSWD